MFHVEFPFIHSSTAGITNSADFDQTFLEQSGLFQIYSQYIHVKLLLFKLSVQVGSSITIDFHAPLYFGQSIYFSPTLTANYGILNRDLIRFITFYLIQTCRPHLFCFYAWLQFEFGRKYHFISTDQKKNNFANSVDPDGTTRNEPPHLDLHCLPFLFCHSTVWHFVLDFCLRDIPFMI